MDWLHCNYCYVLERTVGENQQFFIANCGQVLCGRCTDGSLAKCLFHEHECSYTPVNALKREHEALFTNVVQLTQKNLKYLEFQINQKSSLLTYLLLKLDKMNELKQEMSKLKSECRRHRDEKNVLKIELIAKHDELRQLQNQIQQIQSQQSSRYSSSPSSGYFSNPPANAIVENTLFGASSASQRLPLSPLANHQLQDVFTPPRPVAHRSYNLGTPRRNSPLKSPSRSGDLLTPTVSGSQRARSRTVFLPGDKDRGTSPFSRIGLQHLNSKSAANFMLSPGSGGGKSQRRAPRAGLFNIYK